MVAIEYTNRLQPAHMLAILLYSQLLCSLKWGTFAGERAKRRSKGDDLLEKAGTGKGEDYRTGDWGSPLSVGKAG